MFEEAERKLHHIIRVLLGGRPMKFIKMLFRDVVTGKMVNLYIDYHGDMYMATTRWGWDRERWRP